MKATDSQKARLSKMLTGIDNIGAAYDDREHFAKLTDPLRVAVRNGSDFDESQLAQAESVFSALEAPAIAKNPMRGSYLR